MKKNFFFILVIILIIITFYNYYYEKFSVKVQDAMIFKDYKDNIVGTYPDRNIYPDLFVKAKGEYVNMIGAVHGVSEIKMAKPKDGPKGPKGERGPQGKRGPQGPRGKHGRELIEEDIVNNRNSTCIAPGGISISRMCKGPDGNSPQKPPDGTPGEMCPHPGGYTSNEDGVEIYYGGKCPDGNKGPMGYTCMELIGSHNCPPGQPGPQGDSCAKVNSGLTIINNKCPDGDEGPDGYTCYQRFGHVDGICPVPANGNPGLTCYQRFGPSAPGGLPTCTPSPPGVNSIDCVDPNDKNVKYCGRVNPNIVQDTANNLTINKFNGNELTIDNNKEIQLNGNINLPDNGKIILKNQNGTILKEINKQYIDNMILKSKQCKKCPSDHWNNSNDCEKDQGTCIKCSECPNGYRTSTPCGEHNDAVFVQCSAGYVGKECGTKCDPKKGQYPNSNKTGCDTISSSQYITNDYQIYDVDAGYYRNPNDATNTIICPKGNYCKDGVKKVCPGGQFQTSTGKSQCENCTSNCGAGYYRQGSCTSTSNYSCHGCGGGHYCDGVNRRGCSPCPGGQIVTGGCTGNQNTICGYCSQHTSYHRVGHQQGINWDVGCNGNCKVQFWDNTLSGNDWDVYGKSSAGTWIRGSKASGAIYWEKSGSIYGPFVLGNELYFWQHAPGNWQWKFNVINNHKKYKSGSNNQTYCNTCGGHDRSMGGSCTNDFNHYGHHRLWHGL
jgi:hypothetical protein